MPCSVSMWLAVAALLLPVFLGIAAGTVRLFKKPESAVDVLNRFALYFAFPALIFHEMTSSVIGLPESLGFWLMVPVVLAVLAVGVRVLFPSESPTLALVVSFGNVAYLGLPLVEHVLGSAVMPVAALAVAVHVTLALCLGPVLLLSWSGASPSPGAALRRAFAQPLLWAPIAGVVARALPAGMGRIASALAAPLGKSAAPVALFLLGLYLHAHRSRLLGLQLADGLHVLAKLVVMPALTFGLAMLALRVGWLQLEEAQVLCLLSAMPAAITSFAITHEMGVGTERITRAIVASTAGAAISLPPIAWLVKSWLPSW